MIFCILIGSDHSVWGENPHFWMVLKLLLVTQYRWPTDLTESAARRWVKFRDPGLGH